MTEIPAQLIDTLSNLSQRRPISKEDKTFIKDNLIFLQDLVNEDESGSINLVMTSLSKNRLSLEDKSVLLQNKKRLIEIVDRYKKEFDTSEEELIEVIKSVDDVEQELDNDVTKYCGFSDYHPMQGITFDKTRKRFKIQYNGTVKTNKDAEQASKIYLEMFDDKNSKRLIDCCNVTKRVVTHNDEHMLCYGHCGTNLYDIRHILHRTGLKNTTLLDKYNKHATEIVNYMWHKNKYRGYILRELIKLDTVKKIIYRSNKRGAVMLAKMLGISIIDIKIPSKENKYIQNILTVFKHEKFIEHHKVGRYFVDLYFPNYQLAIECDERGHADRNQTYEKERQTYVEKKLNCKFVRFNPDDSNFDIFVVISKIFYHLKNHNSQSCHKSSRNI